MRVREDGDRNEGGEIDKERKKAVCFNDVLGNCAYRT